MQNWQIHPDHTAGEPGKAFRSLETVFSLQGEPITRGNLGATSRVDVGGTIYYIKLYRQAGRGLRRWVGRSRLRGEWENLQRFANWGIPVAPLAAFGIEKRLGLFTRGAVITVGLPETEDMAQLAKQNDPQLNDRQWVQAVSIQLAQITRTLHSHRFAHGDFKWRNILVTRSAPPQVYLIDCPDGRFWVPPFLQYRKNKDIACLDKVAKRILTRTQRMRFYFEYMQISRLDRKRRRQLIQIIRFSDRCS
jgi:hypothetical protein